MKWTDEELRFVKNNYTTMTHKELADKLGRTAGAVKKFCRIKGLLRRDGYKRKHPYYRIWDGMMLRCHNLNSPAYKNYGARGIQVCEKWREPGSGFWHFVRYMNDECGRNTDGLQIDRIDNDGNYEPGNVRWVTVSENGNNKRTNHLLTIYDETKTIVQWSKDPRCVVSSNILGTRVWLGWDAKLAITTPKFIRRKQLQYNRR